MIDFTKFDKIKLGDAYKEIVWYNPFEDDPDITIEEVSNLMNDYDETVKEELPDGKTFEKYFKH